jgi:hypothetical protein
MASKPLLPQSSRPLRVYSVEEKLIGTAYYHVTATSAEEAKRIFKNRAHDYSMIDSTIDHTGQVRVRWDRSEVPEVPE